MGDYPNHTFEPQTAVRRAEPRRAVRRLGWRARAAFQFLGGIHMGTGDEETLAAARRSVVYVNTKLFGDDADFRITSAVMLPEVVGDSFNDARIMDRRTGASTGRVVDDESPFYDAFAAVLPAGFRVVEGSLRDLTRFEIRPVGSERIPVVAEDLDLCVTFGQERFLGEMPGDQWLAACTLPVPDRARIIRVAGDVGELGFLFGGGTWFHKLDALCLAYTGARLADQRAVLDWGCGCGRILRHFLEAGMRNVTGVDIDAVNVDWVRDTLGFDGVFRTGFDPPLPFTDGQFDVVYGHSVFTHLSREDHDRWLGELRRILRPGGVAFLTVCTEAGTWLTRHRDIASNAPSVTAWLRDGIGVFESQAFVGVDAGREGYYKLVSHTTHFIRDQWSRTFDVCHIVPCFAHHQDLVIIRRPS